MPTSYAEICCEKLFRVQVSNHLSLLSVTLLFAAVMSALSFFGRSTGCSDIQQDNFKDCITGLQHLFTRQVKLFGLDQNILHLFDSPTYR